MASRQISAEFAAVVSGIGFQFFDASGVIGSRVTSGITNPSTGVYVATADDAAAIGVHWDGTDPSIFADEVFSSGGGGATAQEVWEYADRELTGEQAAKIDLITSVVNISSPVSITGNEITVRAGDSWTIQLDALGFIVGATKLWFSVKACAANSDASSVVFLEEAAGLTVINAQAWATPSDGTITVSDATAGDITIAIQEAATLGTSSGTWAVKALQADGSAVTLATGTFTVQSAQVKAIS